MKRQLLTLLALLMVTLPTVADDTRPAPSIRGGKPLSMRMVESEMARIPDAVYMDGVAKPKWNYTTGLELLSIMDAGERYQQESYTEYALDWLDVMLAEDGKSIQTYKVSNYNLDHICPGRLLYRAYDMTGEARYRNTIELLWGQLEGQPRTVEGGYWHKKAYPHQMWLDGLYMAEPFKAEYLTRYANQEQKAHGWEDIVHQFVLVAEQTYDPATGLFRHAWDSSKEMFWCDKESGQSQHAWLRAMGWYTVAIVEVLDYMPRNTEGREKMIGILEHIYKTIPAYADPESGMWYQVMDCPTREGNYEESTGSIMLIYAMMKGARQGYLPREYSHEAATLYEKFVERFMRENEDGTISMINCCAVGGLGGKQNRMGDFAYYLSEPIIENDCKGVGPFIWASMEYEALNNIDYYDLPGQEAIPAFPGAEGGGMWVSGGRGGKVLKVTSLADDGSEGTLRWALNQKGPRMILFEVSGTIELESMLHVTEGDFTLAGESSPGGICLSGHDTRFEADNIIVRHLRFRLGDKTKTQEDALEFRKCTGAIVDHCSVSWSVDECASCYGNRDFTMQYCLIYESLNQSSHKKGNHGYGGIWGGRNASFHHNILAHHTSRNPRLDHPFLYWGKDLLLYRGTVEVYNNVVYNWREKACYGGEEGWWIFANNYFLPGPDTKLTGEFLESSTYPKPYATNGHYHISGNVVEGNEAISEDNWLGVSIKGDKRVEDLLMATPRKMYGEGNPQRVYEELIGEDGAGAKPADKADKRVLSDIATSGGSIINSQEEVGGWPTLKNRRAPKDSDGDGIPNRWERRHGLDPKDGTDGAKISPSGYSFLELYLHCLTGE